MSLDEATGLSNSRKFAKLELTQWQRLQVGALLSQLPALAGLDALSKSMALRFPDGVEGALTRLKTGGYTHDGEPLTDDPVVRKAVNDMLFDPRGEENPRPIEDYENTPRQGMTMGGIDFG